MAGFCRFLDFTPSYNIHNIYIVKMTLIAINVY